MERRAPGDDRPQRRLFREVYEQLHRYCVRLTGDRDLADDAAQEAFVRLFEHEVQGEPKELKSWLFTTATRLIQDRARVEENRRRLLAEFPSIRPEPARPDAVLVRSELRTHVRRVLETLSERDRKMLIMSAEGFSYREIGAVLDIAPTSVGPLLLRARKRFRSAFNRQESARAATG